MAQVKKPHAHAELIKAWADGAEIQVCKGSYWQDDYYPTWNVFHLYRIKPEPIKTKRYRRWVSKTSWLGANGGFDYHVHTAVDREYGVGHIQNSPHFVRWIDEDWQEGVVVDA